MQVEDVELEPGRYPESALGFARSVLRAIRIPRDLVCMNQYHDALFGRTVATMGRVPLVCHLRLLPPVDPCRQWRLGLAGVDRFIAVSKCVRDAWAFALSVAADTIDVVYDGIDTERLRPMENRAGFRRTLGATDDTFVIAYAGRLDREKNLEKMIQAVAALGVPSDRLAVWIAGRPVDHASPEAAAGYVESLAQLAASLGIGGQVKFLGARSDVEELLAAADAAALFSNEEPFGRATIEALACGTPIVAHGAGATREILTGEFARLAFDLERPEQAVEIFRSCMGLRQSDPGFAARAHQHVAQNFSTAAMVEGIERSFQSMVGLNVAHTEARNV